MGKIGLCQVATCLGYANQELGLWTLLDGELFLPQELMRFDAASLEVDYDRRRRHLSYAEPIAMTVVGTSASSPSDGESYVCTFSPEVGLRVYRSEDLSAMVCHAVAPEFMNWGETHFRPDPAHMQFSRL